MEIVYFTCAAAVHLLGASWRIEITATAHANPIVVTSKSWQPIAHQPETPIESN